MGRRKSGKRKTSAEELGNSLPALRMSSPWHTNKAAHKNRIRAQSSKNEKKDVASK